MNRITLIFFSFLFSTAVCNANEPEVIAFWNVSDETSDVQVEHEQWQTVLNVYLTTHPSGINRFDYAALKASDEDMAALNDYLDDLQAMDPRTLSQAEQMPYWINFYNALTVKVITDEYPVDSIKEIHESWIPRSGPWGDIHAEVVGQSLTLDNIEHGILRPIWQDPRIHYAVNCASLGCPNLATQAYTSANTEALLEANAKDYVNHQRGVDFIDEDFVVISSIYNWFVIDFGDSEEGVLRHLLQYAEPDLKAQLQSFDGSFDYEYDWDLNRP